MHRNILVEGSSVALVGEFTHFLLQGRGKRFLISWIFSLSLCITLSGGHKIGKHMKDDTNGSLQPIYETWIFQWLFGTLLLPRVP